MSMGPRAYRDLPFLFHGLRGKGEKRITLPGARGPGLESSGVPSYAGEDRRNESNSRNTMDKFS